MVELLIFRTIIVKQLINLIKHNSFPCSDNPTFSPSDTARSFMKKHRVGHFNEEEMAKKKAEHAAREDEQKAAADAISVGSRCKVQVPGQPTKLATVMYVGKF